nr:nitroreductase family protein [uncultured Methanospirillum sp.]
MKVNFSIASDRCTQCGICSQVCLSSIIIQDSVTKVPVIVDESLEYCTVCGHCESFCPHGAIRIDSPEMVPFPGMSSVQKIQPDMVQHLITSRRTIRKYQNNPIPKENLMDILDIVRYAPSGFNLHPVEWMIVTDPALIHNLSSSTTTWLQSLQGVENSGEYAPLLPVISTILTAWESGEDPICYHAPALIIAHAEKTVHSAGYDAIIALSYLDLIAHVYDLGTCWAGLLQMALSGSPEVYGLLPIPPGHVVHHILIIGKPLYDVHQIPKRPPVKVSFV